MLSFWPVARLSLCSCSYVMYGDTFCTSTYKIILEFFTQRVQDVKRRNLGGKKKGVKRRNVTFVIGLYIISYFIISIALFLFCKKIDNLIL